MIFNFFLIATSFLVGSVFSQMISRYLIFQKGIIFFNTGLQKNIPLINDALAKNKSLDILDFILTLTIGVLIFIFINFIYRNRKLDSIQMAIIGLANFLFALTVLISISFANYSGFQTILAIFIFYIGIFLISLQIPQASSRWADGKRAVFNGLIFGFYLLITLRCITTSIAIPLAIFMEAPLVFYLLSGKIKILNNPSFCILILAFAFPYKIHSLLIIASIFAFALVTTKNRISENFDKILNKIYPSLILFIFFYNPLFYFGNFDSIEEGFWAGWLQRMLTGQIIYRDFVAYHPPTLLYGLFAFIKIFGDSLYNLRLYFHLLQIFGIIIIYYVLNSIVNTKFIKFGIYITILAYCFGPVRNNLEIRVGLGLLPILIIYLGSIRKSSIYLYVAGILSAVSFFVSVETGISSLTATLITCILVSNRKVIIKNVLTFIVAVATVFSIYFTIFYIEGSLLKFFEYVTYYASTFSSGYQNFAIDRPIQNTLVQWGDVNSFISSSGFIFKLSIFSFVSTICLLLLKRNLKELRNVDFFAFGVATFGLILSRSALGRSDEYHIIFIWIPALILLGYLIQHIFKLNKWISVGLLVTLMFYISIGKIQTNLIQPEITKFQTYGNLAGSYPSYYLTRSGLTTNIDIKTNDLDNLVKHIDENTSINNSIFVFPQEPEIYFLANRNNCTSFDTPISFFTEKYQKQIISEIVKNNPKMVIYNKGANNKDLIKINLGEVDKYINSNFKTIKTFGNEDVMQPI
jgi:hypothetical protein